MNQDSDHRKWAVQTERQYSLLFWMIVAGICISPILNHVLCKHESREKDTQNEHPESE